MGATLATVNTIAKEIYEGKIQDQLQEETIALKRIERTSAGVQSEVGAKYVNFPIRVRRNHGIGSRNELELLPSAGQQAWKNVQVGLKYHYGRVQLTGQVIELASANYQAFANAMDLEMTGLKNDLAKDQNRQVYGNGIGLLGIVTADGVGTFTVSNARLIEPGMNIDIMTGSTSTPRYSNRQVTAVNQSTGVVSYDNSAPAGGEATAVAGDYIVRTGNYGREITGLASIVAATGTLFGVDPTTESTWAAQVDSNSGTPRPLSEGLMITMTDNVRAKGGKTSLILTSLGVRRAYFNLLSQQRRYPSTTEFAGGFTGLAFNNGREIPVIEDPDAPPNTMYFLDEDKFKIFRDHDWEWMNRDGSIWKWVVNYDAYEAVIQSYWELGVTQRNAQGVILDITEG